jgi:hypothetical protein
MQFLYRVYSQFSPASATHGCHCQLPPAPGQPGVTLHSKLHRHQLAHHAAQQQLGRLLLQLLLMATQSCGRRLVLLLVWDSLAGRWMRNSAVGSIRAQDVNDSIMY